MAEKPTMPEIAEVIRKDFHSGELQSHIANIDPNSSYFAVEAAYLTLSVFCYIHGPEAVVKQLSVGLLLKRYEHSLRKSYLQLGPQGGDPSWDARIQRLNKNANAIACKMCPEVLPWNEADDLLPKPSQTPEFPMHLYADAAPLQLSVAQIYAAVEEAVKTYKIKIPTVDVPITKLEAQKKEGPMKVLLPVLGELTRMEKAYVAAETAALIYGKNTEGVFNDEGLPLTPDHKKKLCKEDLAEIYGAISIETHARAEKYKQLDGMAAELAKSLGGIRLG